MNRKSLQVTGGWLVMMVLGLSLLVTGCPATTNNPDGGNTPDQTTTPDSTSITQCNAGSACIKVETPEARSCEFLLTNGAAVETLEVAFDVDVIGQSKIRDKRLAVAWVMQKDASFTTGRFVAEIKLKGGVKDLKLTTTNCYDRKGAKLNNPKVTLDIP